MEQVSQGLGDTFSTWSHVLCQGPGLPPCWLDYMLRMRKACSRRVPCGLAKASLGTLSPGRRDGWGRGLAAAHFHSPFSTPPAPGCPASGPMCPDALVSLACTQEAAEGTLWMGVWSLWGSLHSEKEARNPYSAGWAGRARGMR